MKLILLAAAVLTSLLASSCQTTEGFGRDMEHLGNKIEHKAQEQQRY